MLGVIFVSKFGSFFFSPRHIELRSGGSRGGRLVWDGQDWCVAYDYVACSHWLLEKSAFSRLGI